MTDYARWRSEGGRFDGITDITRLTDGRVACCICYEFTSRDALYVDAQGVKWDMCVTCGIDDERASRDRNSGDSV